MYKVIWRLSLCLTCLVFPISATASAITSDRDAASTDKIEIFADTVHSACISLVVEPNASYGNHGIGKVNMDFYNSGDCDTNAVVYLYTGSPIFGWLNHHPTYTDTNVYSGMMAPSADAEFVVISVEPTVTTSEYDRYSSVFALPDTSVYFTRTWYTPKAVDSCSFMIQSLRVEYPASTHYSNIVMGEAIDFDIPSDEGVLNQSGFDISRNLIYQYGLELNQDDTTECQDNDLRYGGLAHIEAREDNGCHVNNDFVFGAFTADNETWIIPNEGFVPSELFRNMRYGDDYSNYEHTDPDSTNRDLHTVMTLRAYDLATTNHTYTYWSVVATTMDGGLAGLTEAIDKGKQWYVNNVAPDFDPDSCSCCEVMLDLNHDGFVDISDLVYFVDYLFVGGPPPVCNEEADCNHDGTIDISDLTCFIVYIFQGGPQSLCP